MSADDANKDDIDVAIWRGDQNGGEQVGYRAPRLPNQTVLDVVTWIQRNTAPDLSYRFACRVGMCGSCAMMVNGKPRWTCRTHVDRILIEEGRLKNSKQRPFIELAPLQNLPVIKDLVCDMADFFSKWQRAEGRFTPRAAAVTDAAAPAAGVSSQSRQAADAAIECINCAICHAACDVVKWNPDYLGPAALNRAWTLLNDVRDGRQRPRLKAISAAGGCQNCHSQQGCASLCPALLNPSRSIAGLKRAMVSAALRRRL